MREILFRAKAINRTGYERSNYKNGDWVYGLVTRLYNEEYDLPAEMVDTNGISGIDVDYKTIGQYTGLKCKNGVKVFEGDIIKTVANSKRLFIVFWSDKSFQFVRKDVHFDDGAEYGIPNLSMLEYEVVGNIYDNPELLEVQND